MIKNSLSGTRSVKSLKVEKPWEPTPSTFHFLSTNFFQWKQSEMPENIHKGVGQIWAFFDLMMPTYCQQNPTGKKSDQKVHFFASWIHGLGALGHQFRTFSWKLPFFAASKHAISTSRYSTSYNLVDMRCRNTWSNYVQSIDGFDYFPLLGTSVVLHFYSC